MSDKKEQSKASVTELQEEDLEQVQGGWSWGESNSGVKLNKKADGFNLGMPPTKK